MLRNILKAYGHAAREIDDAEAIAYLQVQGVPEYYARNLLSLAQSRCRLQFTTDNLSDASRPNIRTVVDSRLYVEWNPPRADAQHEIAQTPDLAIDDSATHRQLQHAGLTAYCDHAARKVEKRKLDRKQLASGERDDEE